MKKSWKDNHKFFTLRILGMDKLAAFLLNEWATDIKKNQLPSLLGGVGPMYSFVQLCKSNIPYQCAFRRLL